MGSFEHIEELSCDACNVCLEEGEKFYVVRNHLTKEIVAVVCESCSCELEEHNLSNNGTATTSDRRDD